MRKNALKDKSRRYSTMIFSGKQMHDGYDSEEEYTTRWTFKNNHYRRPKDIADDKMYTVTFKTGKQQRSINLLKDSQKCLEPTHINI